MSINRKNRKSILKIRLPVSFGLILLTLLPARSSTALVMNDCQTGK